MKATELRIGNYINKDKTVLGLTCLTQTSPLVTCANFDDNSHMLQDIYIKNVKPIPLTEDWLIRFNVLLGFNHCGSQYEVEFAINEYHLRLNYDVGMSKYIGEIKYVHQLQNLYHALTGKELTAKTKKGNLGPEFEGFM